MLINPEIIKNSESYDIKFNCKIFFYHLFLYKFITYAFLSFIHRRYLALKKIGFKIQEKNLKIFYEISQWNQGNIFIL